MVAFPEYDNAITPGMRTFDKGKFVIEKVTNKKNGIQAMTLEGVKSKYGNTYWFVEDWVIPLDEEGGQDETDGSH